MDQSIHNGRRSSASVAYLNPVRHRKNLTIQVHCHVTRILFEGTHAVGIEYRQSSGSHTARASCEVIVSGGAINSPQLLMLSDIGPVAELERHGIPIVVDLPGVGENLRDHWDISVQ